MTALAWSARYKTIPEETGSRMKWSRAAWFREFLDAAMIAMMRLRCQWTVLKYGDVFGCSPLLYHQSLLESKCSKMALWLMPVAAAG